MPKTPGGGGALPLAAVFHAYLNDRFQEELMAPTGLHVRSVIARAAARFRAAWIVLLAFAAATPAAADVVIDWTLVVDAVAPRYGGPQQQARAQAMAQIAVHDALNTIDPRYSRYTYSGTGPSSASPDAAVAAAVRHTLLAMLASQPDSPQKRAAIDTIENAYLSTVGAAPYAPRIQAGIEVGAAAAAAILARRVGDGSDTPHLPYTLVPGPGVYQPTPNPEFPSAITPSFAGWAHVTPFVLRHGLQFEVEPGELFNLAGAAYAGQYNEVKTVGSARVRGALPGSEESDIARFWPGGGSNWNATARTVVSGKGFDRWQHAQLFALLAMAQADALIANQTWKYSYSFWRPVTAIRWPDDGNPDTGSDAVWRPFLATPPYPDYPCALPAATAAAAEVLRQFVGTDRTPFTRTFMAPAVPLPAPMTPLPARSITRTFETLSDAVTESIDARVFAGIHFREGCEAGARQGTQVGRFVVRHSLRPVRGE